MGLNVSAANTRDHDGPNEGEMIISHILDHPGSLDGRNRHGRMRHKSSVRVRKARH